MVGIGAALAGLGALAKVGTGIFQGIKANKLEKRNVRPIQQVQGEFTQNVAEAEQMASSGMPVAEYNMGIQNINRNQAGALRGLSRNGMPGAGLASVLRATNDATMNLDVRSGQLRQQNQRLAMQQRTVLAGEKKDAFDWNEKSTYLAKAAQVQALRGGAAQNIMGGFNDVTQLGAMMGGAADGTAGMPDTSVGFFNSMRKYGKVNNGTSRGLAA